MESANDHCPRWTSHGARKRRQQRRSPAQRPHRDEEREQEVEERLVRQRPGDRVVGEGAGAGRPRLHQEDLCQPAAPTALDVADAEDDENHRHGERQQVHRVDPGQSSGPELSRGVVATMGPGEHETRQDEEERDADVADLERTASGIVTVHAPHGGVVEHDQCGGDEAQSGEGVEGRRGAACRSLIHPKILRKTQKPRFVAPRRREPGSPRCRIALSAGGRGDSISPVRPTRTGR